MRRARSTTGLSTIVPFTASTPSLWPSNASTMPRAHAISPSLGAKTRLIGFHLRRMDAGLAAEAECAGEPALLLESRLVAEVEVHDVERPAQAGRRRVDRDLGARVEDLLRVRPRLEPDFGAEVDRAEDQRGDARPGADLERLPKPHRGLDDGDDGRAFGPECVDRLGARLREHERIDVGRESEGHVAVVPRRPDRVHAHEPRRAVGGGGQRLRHDVAGGLLVRLGDSVLEVADDRVGPRGESLRELARVAARREEE